MKATILAEEAHDLSKIWKTSIKQPFSKPVKRAAPVPGTLEALLSFVEEAATSRLPGNCALEATLSLRLAAKHDPHEENGSLCEYRTK